MNRQNLTNCRRAATAPKRGQARRLKHDGFKNRAGIPRKGPKQKAGTHNGYFCQGYSCPTAPSRGAARERHRISSVADPDQGIVGWLDPVDEVARQEQQLLLSLEAIGYGFVDRQHAEFHDLIMIWPGDRRVLRRIAGRSELRFQAKCHGLRARSAPAAHRSENQAPSLQLRPR